MRKRRINENETDSFSELKSFMERANRESRVGEIFTKDDIRAAEAAIMGTVPKYNPDLGTVIQPNLAEGAQNLDGLSERNIIIAKAIGLADLDEAGTDPEAYVANGKKLFVEENLDILDAFESGSITDDQKKQFLDRMLNWSKGQEAFALGRQRLFEQGLQGFPPQSHEILKLTFGKFEVSIKKSKELTERQNRMNFEEIAKDFGYNLK